MVAFLIRWRLMMHLREIVEPGWWLGAEDWAGWSDNISIMAPGIQGSFNMRHLNIEEK